MSRMKFDGPSTSPASGQLHIPNLFHNFLIGALPIAWPMRFRARLSPENFQRLEQRRSGLAAAHGDPNRQKHLPRFDFQARCLVAQCGFEAGMRKISRRKNLARSFEHEGRHRGIALLRNQFGRIVRREFVDEEQVSRQS